MSVISVNNASVAYRQYARSQDALLEWLLRKSRHEVFHALQDINFELEQGGSMGIVGDNGAGKSTLLRMLAGNISPTKGYCHIEGQRSALLELGAGLHPEFSGAENARIGLALRGLQSQTVEEQLPGVLEFAELGEFAAQPIKNYSSGMVVRLVFAIAAVIEPDVLIVDEALSVGDQYFQKKSMDRMRSILDGGATLVFCSHNLYQVREICQQAVWLEQGKIKMIGEAQLVVDAYQDSIRSRVKSSAPDNQIPVREVKKAGHDTPALVDVSLLGGHGVAEGLLRFMTYQRFAVRVVLDSAGYEIQDIHVGVVIRRNDEVQCYGISTLHDGVELVSTKDNLAEVRFVIESLPLLSGEYCLEVWLIDGSGMHVYDARERCCYFRVQQESQAQGVGMNWIPHRWEVGTEISDVVTSA